MKDQDRRIAEELRQRLSEVVALVDFFVFGSRAHGDADEYSDLNVFMEVESINRESREKIFDVTWEIGFNNYLVISPLVVTREELENSPFRSAPIVRSIFEEGVRL